MKTTTTLHALLCLAMAGLHSVTAQGTPLSPDDGSISGNLGLWLRDPATHLDADSGVWLDVSGNENHAEPVGQGEGFTFVGPTLASGENPLVFGQAFSTALFAGDTPDLLRATNVNGGAGLTDLTIFAVYGLFDIQQQGVDATRAVGFSAYLASTSERGNNFNLSADMTIRKDNGFVGGATVTHPTDQFFIRVSRMNPGGIDQWANIDGTLLKAHSAPGNAHTTSTDNFYLGDLRGTAGSGYSSQTQIEIAEVIVYNASLSEEQIAGISEWLQANVGVAVGAGQAGQPNPAADATDVFRDAELSWSAGEFAVTHDVYLGTSFADVNDASADDPKGVLVSRAQQETSFDPARFDFGQTYYWRVDEVNGAPDFSVYTGDVWAFTVEPFSVSITSVTATASSAFGASVPENTINGSGLMGNLHGTSAPDMWISAGLPASIEYAFDKVYRLHEVWIWNSNQLVEAFVGFGAKDVTVETSTDGEAWEALAGVGPLKQAPGAEAYAHSDAIDFQGTPARFVRITVESVHGIAPQGSLSEVRFFAVPTFATRPAPESGAIGVSPDVTLAWGRDGREAATHEVYLGTDPNDLALVASVEESRFSTEPSDLQLGQAYHWRVDEVNGTMDPSRWVGDLWAFTSVSVITIDDMESYADKEFLEIWATWVDGFDDPANGALVGNGVTGSPETARVHGGGQALPLHYDNNAAAQSEATRTFDTPMDWTRHGVKSLVLYFEGDSTSSGGSLYVKINDTKITYDGDVGNLMRLGWNKWAISLADVSGATLDRVTSMAIGVEGGGQGVLRVDDILLTAEDRLLISPVEPLDGLVAYYPLDGDFQDASGNGLHGTPMGAPAFEAGALGQAVGLNGIDQYLEITGYKGITAIDQVQQPFTISNWFKTLENGEMVTWGASPGGERLSWRIDGGSLRTEHGSGNLRGNTVANDGEWHHGALVVNEGANLRPAMTKLYMDGIEDSTFSGSDNPYNLQADTDLSIGQRATSGDRRFPGALDEVRIYDRALSAGEVAWLAGRTADFDSP